MNIDVAVKFTQSLIEKHTKKALSDSQKIVLRGSLECKSYKEIYNSYKISEHYGKEIGQYLWSTLSDILGVTITKTNVRAVIEQHLSTEQEKISNSQTLPKCNDKSRDFVGRDTAINDIHDRINEGIKIIVIQAAGGVGKTTLAKQYLYKNFDLVLPLEMAKDTENITAVESEIETWLKQYFQEEPGRDFKTTITRLKQQLQNHKVGILIDNLEPALDKQGRLLEKHSLYVELLRVLGDEKVQSLTLITSRERLCDDRLNSIYHYPLAVLTIEAWQEFFTTRKIKIDTPSLAAMYEIHGGNAKAMDILFGVMREDYDGDMAAYWLENSTCVETELKNLVESQFNRLQTLDNEAYKLLCRLGCFRYQDVPRVSCDALLALLWDVPQEKQRDVIKALKNRCLVEFEKGEYWLHPVIRKQGIERLKASGEWEEVNRKAAEFWTEIVKTVENIDDAHRAFESYYHFVNISKMELAVEIIIKERDNSLEKGERLSDSLYRLGIFEKVTLAVDFLLKYIHSDYYLSIIYNLKGDNLGKIRLNDYIKYHAISKKLAEKCLDSGSDNGVRELDDNQIIYLKKLRIYSLFNIGHLKIFLGEIEQSLYYFEQIEILLEIDYIECQTHPWYFLAFIYSYLGNIKKTYLYIDLVYQNFNRISSYAWSRGYSIYILAQTYHNLTDYQNSFEMYNRAISYSEEINFTELKSISLTGLAELNRKKGNFEQAIANHLQSIQLLNVIGAKYYLAEAYYQLGLTYQKMGEIENSNTNFNAAIQLYQEMEAPKQVEKVETAKSQN